MFLQMYYTQQPGQFKLNRDIDSVTSTWWGLFEITWIRALGIGCICSCGNNELWCMWKEVWYSDDVRMTYGKAWCRKAWRRIYEQNYDTLFALYRDEMHYIITYFPVVAYFCFACTNSIAMLMVATISSMVRNNIRMLWTFYFEVVGPPKLLVLFICFLSFAAQSLIPFAQVVYWCLDRIGWRLQFTNFICFLANVDKMIFKFSQNNCLMNDTWFHMMKSHPRPSCKLILLLLMEQR